MKLLVKFLSLPINSLIFYSLVSLGATSDYLTYVWANDHSNCLKRKQDMTAYSPQTRAHFLPLPSEPDGKVLATTQRGDMIKMIFSTWRDCISTFALGSFYLFKHFCSQASELPNQKTANEERRSCGS